MVKNYFDVDNELGNGAIENIIFSDGTKLTSKDMIKIKTIATNGDDGYYLTSSNDEFNALGGILAKIANKSFIFSKNSFLGV